MPLLESFFRPDAPSLKICGVTSRKDIQELIALSISAVGINFWPQSKRFIEPQVAREFLPDFAKQILRVGVFVNNARTKAPALLADNSLDIVQLHGDEPWDEVLHFLNLGIPTIRAMTLKQELSDEQRAAVQRIGTPFALLLDAHAPGVYGGTGHTIDWLVAANLIKSLSPIPVFLAGGIGPHNAAQALQQTYPAGLDVASGGESEPGIKDFEKIRAIHVAFRQSI